MRPEKIWLEDDWIRAVYYDSLYWILRGLAWPRPPLAVLEYAKAPGIIPMIIGEVRDMVLTLAPWPEYDIEMGREQFGDRQFDAVIADQVLEHTPDVVGAVRNCALLCRRGGVLIFGTPWQYPYHPAPKDFWRISRDAYQMMFDRFGIDTIVINGWGHKEALIFGHQTDGFLRAVDDEGNPVRTVAQAEEARLFEIENDPDHAIQIWACGRKR